ncbi:Predicted arabinose efflux permease, MFS family [Palleronia salina]|uniref:Predicted arabinose efflux permease, MFS family n=1 Tax=Palleronia salina TaxID=313368 RepID=A0A1M6DCY9_9RHOB|nr:organoarsenical effux MFS transporter ArsJ [Palleronia salina]SHI71015.1 Predicted arabinose efflux permease, MFS family [Palleronia salina]
MSAADRPLAAYATVTAAYWAFMLTDGALRMLVLLHFHELGFSPVQLAFLFTLYEVAGMVTNLAAGWLAARFGLTRTLYLGLGVQVVALAVLTRLDPGWAVTLSVTFVMLTQAASGVAKDLTKMSAKSAVKLLAPGDGALFRWVAALTGSKNAVKGLGFFLGAALLAWLGFRAALWSMAGTLALILLAVLVFMPTGLPQGRKGAKFSEVFSKDPAVNWLSAARMFLFGARDTWFVVGIPVFFQATLTGALGWDTRDAFFAVGGFMAVWITLYGAVQAGAPRVLRANGRDLPSLARGAASWLTGLIVIPLLLALAAMTLSGAPLVAVVVIGLFVFGAIFAVNSSLHSFLILAFSTGERVTLDVGFYYMSNAAGRLLGTLLSGISFQLGGLPACLATAAAMAALSLVAARKLPGGAGHAPSLV